MELELGLKITRTPLDSTSTSEVWFPRNRSGPLFVSKETDTTIVLTGYLKGYRWENISIRINEHGTRIVVSGEKPVREMIMMGWIVLKKQVEIREFRKVFRIPDGVVLNRIKAKFNEDGSVLTIQFPKSIKGISGVVVDEEPEETDEIPANKEDDQILSVEETRRVAEDDDIRERQAEFIDKPVEKTEETNGYQEKVEESRVAGANAEQNDEDLVAETESREAALEAIDENEEEQARTTADSATKEAENENAGDERRRETKELENNGTPSSKTQEKNEAVEEEQTEKTREIAREHREEQKDDKNEHETQPKAEKKKTWNPFVIAGSAFVASSLIVVVLGFARAKRKDKK